MRAAGTQHRRARQRLALVLVLSDGPKATALRQRTGGDEPLANDLGREFADPREVALALDGNARGEDLRALSALAMMAVGRTCAPRPWTGAPGP